MPDALLTSFGELQAGGKVYRWGVPNQPTKHTVTADNVRDAQFDVAGSGSGSPVVLLWTALVDLPASFKLLVLESDQDVVVEFVTDDGGEVGEEVYTVTVSAGLPLILGSDQSYANHSVNFAGGTLDVIEAIRAKNLGATDANVRLLLSD